MFTRAVIAACILLPVFTISSAQVLLPDSPELAKALDSAGANRAQLERVLSEYADDPDSLKHQAACYLIANLEGHSYVTYMLCDSNKTEIPFNVLDYASLEALEIGFDSLQTQKGELSFKKKDLIEDSKTITADLLRSHIDFAFRAWREKPWAQRLTFEQFCSSVLPYRGSNEPLEEWREFFWDKYAEIADRMKDSTDPIEAASLINQDIMSWFRFDSRYYYHPTDQGLSEMKATGLGRCEDMTNLAIFGMRALGLAVTSDYTPYWANSGNNHAWNAIITLDGRAIPFMGAEANPGSYRLANKLAKAYRKTYEIRHENLVFQPRKQEKLPGWLAGKSYTDVTRDYTDARTISVKLLRPVPDTVDIAYLCVFNSGEWQAIHWARIADGEAVFTDMGTGVVYLPALYEEERMAPAGLPFILDSNGQMTDIVADRPSATSVSLGSITNAKLETSTDGIERTWVKAGQEYELFFWDDGWQSIAKSTAEDTLVNFGSTPSKALYWLQPVGSKRDERPFTIEAGTQVWW
jgi:hypothetical protein